MYKALLLMIAVVASSSALLAQSDVRLLPLALDAAHYYHVDVDHGATPKVTNITLVVTPQIDQGASLRVRMLDVGAVLDNPTNPDINDHLVESTITSSDTLSLNYTSPVASGVRQYIIEFRASGGTFFMDGNFQTETLPATMIESLPVAGEDVTVRIGNVVGMRSVFRDFGGPEDFIAFRFTVDHGVLDAPIRYVTLMQAMNVSRISVSATDAVIQTNALPAGVLTLEDAVRAAFQERFGNFPGFPGEFTSLDSVPSATNNFDQFRYYESSSNHSGLITYEVIAEPSATDGDVEVFYVFPTETTIASASRIVDSGPNSAFVSERNEGGSCALSLSGRSGIGGTALFTMLAFLAFTVRRHKRAESSV